MKTKKPLGFSLSTISLVLISACSVFIRPVNLHAAQVIIIDASKPGRVFEGIGACSAGASSRLLIDYPEPYRSHILDYLFKPNYGASFQHLKVEIGGGVNSTDGTEPSHAYTRAEFESPKHEYYDRGYEWWLMKQAKKRNPDIFLDCLEWGAPGWLGGGQFYSQDNADYIAAFIKGAKKYHNLTIDYTGIWNERLYDAEWIKMLRRTLDKNNLRSVKIAAADMHWDIWRIVDDMSIDPALKDAVHAVGVHYPIRQNYESTDAAKQCGRPLFSSEDGPWRGNWYGACKLAIMYNRNYAVGKMTKTVIWSPVSSYYENLPLPNSGVMKANTPWSAHYHVQPALWATAHTTQFAKPGWIYLDTGCGLLDDEGSFVTLRKPDRSGHYSIIIETVNATKSQTPTFNLTSGLSSEKLHVWRTNQSSSFTQLPDIVPRDNSFSIVLEPRSIYSLTTTTGQRKGSVPTPAPVPADFPMPYEDDFESCTLAKQPKYFSDQAGSFEVAARTDGKGKCLRQLITQKGIEWAINPFPETFIGNIYWTDYEVSSDVYIEDSGFVTIFGRLGNKRSWNAKVPNGYWLMVDQKGNWTLKADSKILAAGSAPFSPNTWHNLKLKFAGPCIAALIDNRQVANAIDIKYKNGMAGVGSGWNNARFDSFKASPYTGPPPKPVSDPKLLNLALAKTAAASSTAALDYNPNKATDGDHTTRWSSAPGTGKDQWLEIDFGAPTTFDTTITRQFRGFIVKYKIQYWDGSEWKDAHTAGKMEDPSPKIDTFSPVTANKMRYYITSKSDIYNSVSLWELEVYNSAGRTHQIKNK
jgi:galactosylceramidase